MVFEIFRVCTVFLIPVFILIPVHVYAQTILCKRYAENSEYRNKKFHTNKGTEFVADSLIRCALECTDTCTCFGFNTITSTCRIHGNCTKGLMNTTDDNGWINYDINIAGSDIENKHQPANCQDLFTEGYNESGVYTIFPWSDSDPHYRPVQVFCDMEIGGGGWTVVQKRLGGSLNFNRNWSDYKIGFGEPNGSYWLGNDVLHQLTQKHVALYVSMTLLDLTTFHAQYRTFSVGDEMNKYKLRIEEWMTGTLGDSFLNTTRATLNLGEMFFSTFDQDNDLYPKNCAAGFGGGWWFNACHYAFLNGPMSSAAWISPWNPPFADGTLINKTIMMIKPL